mmetsp:Transcript_34501/g.87627  ORF Transcript_34501/g.87627 Transcript_34501/m.87627 type:complete len:218 (+) Transcript_34501:152-805(+)
MVQPRAPSFASAHATISTLLSKDARTFSTTSLNLAQGSRAEGLDSASEIGTDRSAGAGANGAAIACEHGLDVPKGSAETWTGNPVTDGAPISCTRAALIGTKAGASAEKGHGNCIVLRGPSAISGVIGWRLLATFSDAAVSCGATTGAASGTRASSAGMCTTSSNAAKDTRLAGVVGELLCVLRPAQLGLLKQPVLRGDSSPKSSSESPPKAKETCC